MSEFHTPVLKKEVIDGLNIQNDSNYIDATVGGGGHTIEILKHGGRVLGIDVDQDAIEYIQEKLRVQNLEFNIGEKLRLVRGNFKDIEKIAQTNGFSNISGILFDLGVSSHQLEEEGRGFSFQTDAILDMRMDKSLGVTAADLVNGLTEKELYELFTKLGEEHRSRTISAAIVRARRVSPITTTGQLARLVENVKGKSRKIHPATQVFQALRMAVNGELENLREGLRKSIELLDVGGRIVVITFHSLEDRIVKHIFKELEEKGAGKNIYKKPVLPSQMEIELNPRARSAKLRVFEKGQ